MGKSKKQPDLDRLITATRKGDESAFRELMDRYKHLAYAGAIALLKDFHLAQDVVQESFLTVYYQLHTLKKTEAFPSWLHAIVRHSCHRILRSRGKRALNDDGQIFEQPANDDPDHLLQEKERQKLVLDAIARLPLKQREIVFLYYIEEYTQEEVARFMGVPKSTVNNRLYAARQVLKRRMVEMVKRTMKDHRLPDDFVEKTARIIRIQGPIIEAQVSSEKPSSLFDGWMLSGNREVDDPQFTIIQRDNKNRIRLIGRDKTSPPEVGSQISMMGEDYLPLPCDDLLTDAIAELVPQKSGKQQIIETGIKIIDLMAPLPSHGAVGLLGIQGVGRAILVMELYHRLQKLKGRLSVIYFVSKGEAASLKLMIDRMPNFPPDASGPLETAWLISSNAADPDFLRSNNRLDVSLFFSPLLSCRLIYPAIDTTYSFSNMLRSGLVSPEHLKTVDRINRLIEKVRRLTFDPVFQNFVAIGAFNKARQYNSENPSFHSKDILPEDQIDITRVRKLELFFSQPFYSAEEFTKVPGKTVSLEDTINGCKAILDGEADDMPEEAFAFTGSLEDVKNKV